MVPVDFSVVAEALKQKDGDIVLGGKLDSTSNPENTTKLNKESQEKFKHIVEKDNNKKSLNAKVIEDVQNHDYNNVFESFGMPVFQQDIRSAVTNSGVIGRVLKGLTIFSSVCLVGFALYRVILLKKHEHLPFNFKNVVLAILFPSALYTKRVREKLSDNDKKLEQIIIKINDD